MTRESDVGFRPTTVSMDGGPCEARLAFSDGALVAVFTRVPAEAPEHQGWFREAGFGPCSDLFTVPPGIFPTLDHARDWIGAMIAEKKQQE